MNLQDTLNTLLVIGFLVIASCIIFITYYLIKTLKSITSLVDSLQNTSESIKAKLQMKFVSLIPALVIGLLGKIFKKREEVGR